MSLNTFIVIQIIADNDLNNERIVVPLHWIKSVVTQYPKYLNYGLNRNQIILVYYSHDAIEAIEQGEPAHNFQPNFSLDSQTSFSIHGCYKARPCKCFGMSYRISTIFFHIFLFDKFNL